MSEEAKKGQNCKTGKLCQRVGCEILKKSLFLLFILMFVVSPANSAQQYIQKLHEQQKQQSLRKQEVQKSVIPAKNVNSNETKSSNTSNNEHEKLYQKALEQLDEKNLYGAHTSLCKALEKKHDFVKAIKRRGFVRNQLADYNGAIVDFNNAISLSPNDGDLYYGRGTAKLAMQNYADAVDDLTKAVELNPEDEESFHQRGYAYALWGKSTNTDFYFIKAQLDFNKVLNMNPDNTEAHLYRGMVFCERGKKEKGLPEIEYAMNTFKEKGDEDAYQRSVQIYNWIKEEY